MSYRQFNRPKQYNPALVEDTNRTSDLLAELGFNQGGQPPPYEEEEESDPAEEKRKELEARVRAAEEKAAKAEKTFEEQKKMDKSKLALVMQKMKTAEQQRDGYKKQVQWFRGNAPHIEMPMEIAQLPDSDSTSPSGASTPFTQGGSVGGGSQVDTAAANGRIEELEKVVGKQKQAIEILKTKRTELEAKLEKAQINGGGGGASASAANGSASQLAELRRESEEQAAQLKAAKAQEEELVKKLKQLASAYRQLKEQGSSKDGELEARAAKLDAREAELKRAGLTKTAAKQLHAHVKSLRQELSSLRRQVVAESAAVPEAIGDLIKRGIPGLMKVKDLEVQKCQEKYLKEAALRRKLHNLVQDLRGNIRVFVRCRPLMREEKTSCVSFPEEDMLAVRNEIYGTNKSWTFDKVFRPESTQAQVYEEVSNLVVSMLDGYNICVFAYGQTGSGKTHSMQGNPQEPGIYRRTFRNYFEVIKERGSDWKYKLSVALLEVYNDEVYDLLDTASVRRKLQLRQSKEGGVQIPDLTCRPVASDEDISNVLATGESNRSVASTNMNEHSSRSHLIVQVHAEITMPNGKEVNSKMNLIDLAGSERLKTSGAEGARAKETMHINKSLSSLGDVIAARASKASHVPYRESKLTHLLQDSLGGESKTLMLLQISPVEDSCDETTNSLNFGSRVNAVEMDKPTKKGAAK